MWKMAFFGLTWGRWGQDMENRAEQPQHEFPGETPRENY